MRKGFVFTLDALLSLVLVSLILVSIVAVTSNSSDIYATSLMTENKQLAQGILQTMRTVPLDQLVSPSLISNWISNGTLNLTYVSPKMPPLQIAATYWALSPKHPEFKDYASEILGEILRNLADGYKYQLIINNYTSPYLTFDNSYENASDVGTATMMVSGYLFNQSPRGYVAKAYLAKLITRQYHLMELPEILTGRVYSKDLQYNSLKVNTAFELPSDASNISGRWLMINAYGVYLPGRGVVSAEIPSTSINGYELDNPQNAILSQPPLKPGENTIEVNDTAWLVYDKQQLGVWYGFLTLNYTTSTPQIQDPGQIRIWNVVSDHTGIMYLQPVFVPGNITSISIKLTVQGVHSVRIYAHTFGNEFYLVYEKSDLNGEYTSLNIPNSTIMPNITQYISMDVLNTRSWNLVIALDSYYNETAGRFDYSGQDYNLSSINTRTLFGYPRSYVNISYKRDLPINSRFMLPIEILKTPSGTGQKNEYGYYTGMTFEYSLPSLAIPWYVTVTTDRFIILGSGGSYPIGTIIAKEGLNSQYNIIPPFQLDYNMLQFSYRNLTPNILVPDQENTFLLESNTTDYTFRPWNSRAIVHYFLRAYAPYGNVFTYYSQNNACGYNLTYWYNLTGTPEAGTVVIGNCPPAERPIPINASQLEPDRYALDDAIVRLLLQLGASKSLWEAHPTDSDYIPGGSENPIRIEMKQLAGKAIGIRNVPTALSPIQVTLRIWRGG